MKKMVKIILNLFLFGFMALCWVASAHALAASHLNENGCNTCHGLHGAPGQESLLNQADAESTCLSCHGPFGPVAVPEASIHDPNGHGTGNLGYITCLECHNPHTNGDDLSTPRTNSNGGYNIKLIGREADFKVREELTSGLGPYKDVVFEASPDDWTRPDGFGVCQTCHAAPHNEGADCRSCHEHSGGFAGAGCTGCHDGAGAGAESISVDSPHSTNTIFSATGDTFLCEDCHTGHGAGDYEVPNNITVGINYGSNGESGIALSDPIGTATTEAEICWNCHDVYSVTEWGVNTDTNGTENNYDFGSLSQSNWIGASWNSANGQADTDPFWYKRGAIQSTHAVDGSATTPGLDLVDDLRCSYCHDVHDLNTLASDDSSGKPYLRGTWRGNPYLEDGAPQSGTSYGQYNWGDVPRASVLNDEYGGYQIDLNNGNPTNGWTLADSAGLCTVCHGSDVDNMNEFDVDEAGVGETPGQSWVGTNGHSNAVIGGTGANEVNIFYTSDRAPSGVDTEGANPDMGYANHGTAVGYGFRGTDGRSFLHTPGMDGSQASNSSRPYGGRYYEWVASVDEGSIDPQYHEFSCSKCHNPHASRLPRLMITNCLDTTHNTWDEDAGDGGPSIANENNNKVVLGAATSPDNWGRTWSNTTSAQNCHRVAGDNRGTPVPGFGSGWNNVTPW